MFSLKIKALLGRASIIISELMCTLQEDFDDVFTVVYNQVYEELKIAEMDKKNR
jgi:hypothetical protein